MGNLASATHPHAMDAAIRRARRKLRLMEPEPCMARRERKWPIPEPVQVAMLKAMRPEMEEARIRRLLREGRISLPGKKYHLEEVRRATLLSFAEHMRGVGKEPIDIGDGDFDRNGLGWLANRHGSSFEALKSVGLLSEKDRHAFRFKKGKRGFGNRENRVKALRDAAKHMGDKPRLRHFKEPFPKVYAMIINHYHGHVSEAYQDAGLVAGKDEAHMRARNKGG